MKKILNSFILACIASSCVSQNSSFLIKHYEKCVDVFCLSNVETLLMDMEDVDEYIHDGSFTLINSKENIYLCMTHYPGDPEYKMSLFEIGYISTIDTLLAYEYDGSFITDNQTALGDTEEKVIKLQGLPHKVSTIDNYKVYHFMVDESNSIFVQENNEYAYIIEYWFIDGKLAKLIFGFDYP
ncbi:MAG: hypothetical protein F082_2016 [bacterium F082]|nr:MAG: hypothetical protein F082_2016 [bacterium F082]